MKSSFVLKIEKPCSENWSSMIVNDTGKFCSNCQKNVIDFSTCSDDEIIRVLEKLDGKICGRLKQSQLDRILVATKNRKVSPHLNKILAGLFILGMVEASDLKAQTNPNNQTVLQNKVSLDGNGNVQKQEHASVSKDSTQQFISGKVLLDLTNAPVAAVNVYIKNSSIYATTDSLGNFRLTVPDSLLTDTITLWIISYSYGTSETKIAKTNLQNAVTIITTEQEEMIMGEFYMPTPPKKQGKKKK
jgi:hypothetical protein